MVLTMVIDEILIRDVVPLILVLSKVASFHNEAHTHLFLSKKLGTNFLILLFGIYQQSLIDIQIAFLFLSLFYRELKDNHCVILVILLDIKDQLQQFGTISRTISSSIFVILSIASQLKPGALK